MSTSSTTSNSERKIMRGDDVANNNMTTIIKIGSHSSVIISHGNTSSVSESSSKTAGGQQEDGKEDTRINLTTKIRELDDTEEDSSSDFDDVTVSHRDEGITASPKSSTSGASTLSSGIESGISCGGGDSVVVVGGGGAMHHPMSTRCGHYLSFILLKFCNQGSLFESYEREKYLA